MSRKRQNLNLLARICGLAVGGPGATAAVWYVDAAATGPSHDGTTWCSAYLNLQDGLAAAASGDEVRVADGTYKPDQGSLDRYATFRLINGVALRGGYAGCGAANPNQRDVALFPSVLSGDLMSNDGPNFANYADNSYHVVTNDDPAVTNSTVLDGFTIRGGNANGTLAAKTDQGSGLHNHSGVGPLFSGGPLVTNCLFKDNWAANHGAVNDHGGMTLINCEFRDNFAGMWGGGLYIHETLATTVTDCRFYNNKTDGTSGGGGGAVHEGQATFTNCLFSGNTSKTNGGGMYNHGGGVAVLRNCTFAANRAEPDPGSTSQFGGGGIYNESSTVDVDGCTFTDNFAFTYGGGIYSNQVSSAVVTDSTFLRNRGGTTSGGGGGLANRNSSVVETHDCFFGQNTGYYAAGIYNTNSSATVTGSAFDGGNAVSAGIYSQTSGLAEVVRLSCVNCSFINNNYGAVYVFEAVFSELEVELTGCLFKSNRYLPSVKNERAHVVVTNCTLTLNENGGIHTVLGGTTHVANSILWANGDGPTETEQISVIDGLQYIDHSCVQGWTGNLRGVGNFGSDPNFVNPASDFRLAGNSPCIDAGRSEAVPASVSDDLDDKPRFVDSALRGGISPAGNPLVDIGAYEYFVDCNGNFVLDAQDISSGTSSDCNGSGIPDECEKDCNGNGTADECDLAGASSSDCNNNTVPDECETDCNVNGFPDDCDITVGTSPDVDNDGLPDECYQDCNDNGVSDRLDLDSKTSRDCNANGVPDECDVSIGISPDSNVNGVPDPCDQIIFVDAGATGSGDGSSWHDAFPDLQEALEFAQNVASGVTEIWVANGTYKPDRGSGDRAAVFQLINDVTLYGGFAGGETRLDQRNVAAYETLLSADLLGDDQPRVGGFESNCCVDPPNPGFGPPGCDNAACEALVCARDSACCSSSYGWYFNCTSLAMDLCCDLCGFKHNVCDNAYSVVKTSQADETAVIDGFTIRDAVRDSAMTAYYSRPTVRRCLFTENFGLFGPSGGLTASFSRLTVTDSTFQRNRSRPSGGAMHLGGFESRPRITRCKFLENTASIGGAVAVYNGENVVFNECEFLGNRADWNGGALYADVSATVALTGCLFSGNVASTGYGGAVYFLFPLVTDFTNCTFVGNVAGEAAGAIRGAQGQLRSCIFWDNRDTVHGVGQQGAQLFTGTFTINYSTVQGWTGSLGGVGNHGNDPRFEDPDGLDDLVGTPDDNLHLLRPSPAIDAGDVAFQPSWNQKDLDGRSRVFDGDNDGVARVDMGAYESQIPIYGDVAPPGGDGIVELADAMCVLAGYAQFEDCRPGDIWPCPPTGDGMIELSDVLMLLAAYGGQTACP